MTDTPNDILIVGDSFLPTSTATRKPFSPVAEKELQRLCAEAGIVYADCTVVPLFPQLPIAGEIINWFSDKSGTSPFFGLHPNLFVMQCLDRLFAVIRKAPPKLIIVTGNYALWAVTAEARIVNSDISTRILVPTGIGDFRGSMLHTRPAIGGVPIPVLPILSPDIIMKSWEMRSPTLHDLKTRVPKALHKNWSSRVQPTIVAQPTFKDIYSFFINQLHLLDFGRKIIYSHDIETRNQIITCMGFATSRNYAIVLPFVKKSSAGLISCWTTAEEATLTKLLCKLLSHPNASFIGQNYSYDSTYIHRFYNILPKIHHDTMTAQHLIFPGTQKDLGYLSSIYCEYHRYWKDDNKEWDSKSTLEAHFRYNGEDCIRTFEIAENQLSVIKSQKLETLWQKELAKLASILRMSVRGVRIDTRKKAELAMELSFASQERIAILLKIVPQHLIDEIVGKPSFRKKTGQIKQQILWPTSTAKQQILFYTILNMAPQKNRKTQNTTLDKEAIPKLMKKYPFATRIFTLLLELRSIEIFANTFVNAKTDPDQRMRTSFNTSGTETFRLSSSKNAFGTGCNFQNLPSGKEL